MLWVNSLDTIHQEWVAEFPLHGVGNDGSEIAAGDVEFAAGGNSIQVTESWPRALPGAPEAHR